MMKNIYLVLVCLSSLLLTFPCLDWQGTGNMSASNLTDIWTYINANINVDPYKNYNMLGPLGSFPSQLSSYLNNLWNAAWNVVISVPSVQIDTVVYGYAFRDHWMWYNSYIVNGLKLNIVIWKDYNCKTWIRPFSNMTDMNQTLIDSIASSINGASASDIWTTAKGFVDYMQAQPANAGHAYTIVMSQGNNTQIINIPNVCATQNLLMGQISSNNGAWGKFILFSTR